MRSFSYAIAVAIFSATGALAQESIAVTPTPSPTPEPCKPDGDLGTAAPWDVNCCSGCGWNSYCNGKDVSWCFFVLQAVVQFEWRLMGCEGMKRWWNGVDAGFVDGTTLTMRRSFITAPWPRVRRARTRGLRRLAHL